MADVSLLIAFVAGLLSFLNPCVLPLVPGFLGYLSGTAIEESGGQRLKVFWHSVFFVLGFSVLFALAGVILGSILQGASFAVKIWLGRVSGGLIILFGCQLLGILNIGFLGREKKVPLKGGRFSPYVVSFLFGAAFGLSWTPCVGLILGSVLALAVTHPAASFVLLVTYALGMGLPFLLVGLFSSFAVKAIRRAGSALIIVNKAAGVFLIILGVFIAGEYLNVTIPAGGKDGLTPVISGDESKVEELAPADGFINTAPFALKNYLGKKVILLDFWRFGCPNCQEMAPVVEEWHNKYKDLGLEVIGVHSPEFETEKNGQNVKDAVFRMGITYPVVLDNERQNLNLFNVIYWPTLLLIDLNGHIVSRHIGAGGYKDIEDEIVRLLSQVKNGQ